MTDDLTDNQRILQTLQTAHLEFPRDVAFRDALVEVVDLFRIARDPKRPWGLGNRVQQRGVFVYAPSGSGKTALVADGLEKFRHPEDGSDLTGRYITVEAPTPFYTKELLLVILKRLGCDLTDGKEARLAEMVRRRCHELGIFMIHIDEFNRVNSLKLIGKQAKKTEAKTLGESLASLMTGSDWPLSLVVSGIDHMIALWDYEVFETAARRVVPFALEPVDDGYRDAMQRVFAFYLTTADCVSELDAKYDLFGRVRKASLNRLGVMLWYMQEACIRARRNGDRLVKPAQFAALYSRISRCGANSNLFLEPKWKDISLPAKLEYEKL